MRIVTAREQYEMQAPWRTAGALPEGLSISHVGTDPWDRDVVQAHHNGQPVGRLHVENADPNFDIPASVGLVTTHPDYRRMGVGTAMLNWARENIDPGIEHSDEMTDAGHAWSQSLGHDPDEYTHIPDYNDADTWNNEEWRGRYSRRNMTAGVKSESRKFYHVSPHDLPVGTVLTPQGGQSPWQWMYDSDISGSGGTAPDDADQYMKERGHVWIADAEHVPDWLEETGGLHPGGYRQPGDPMHVYEVAPHTEPEDMGPENGFRTPKATIKKLVHTDVAGDGYPDYDAVMRKITGEKKAAMSPVTLYTKPSCPQCRLTKQQLDKHNIPHNVVDLSLDDDAYRHVTQNLGYSSAPVVHAGDDNHWSGFRPDRIKALAG